MPKRLNSYAQVEVKRFKISALRPAPYNARTISSRAASGLAASLETFGLLSLPVVNILAKGGPRIVGGHQRIDQLKAAKVEEVDCIVVKFSPEQEKEANFALNNPTIQGEFIPGLTRDLITQLSKIPALQAQMRELNMDLLLKQVYKKIEAPAAAEPRANVDAVPKMPVKSKPFSSPGAVYALGESRLYVSVPPPHDHPIPGVDGFVCTILDLRNGGQPFADDYLSGVLSGAFSRTSGPVYAVTNVDLLTDVHRSYLKAGGSWRNTLVWVFDGAAPDSKPYQDISLPVIYGGKAGHSLPFYGGNNVVNVFTAPGAPSSDPPVVMFSALLHYSSKEGDACFVPDVGSGACFVGAARASRVVHGWSPQPRSADVVRRRWAEAVHGKNADWVKLTPEVK